MNNSREWFILCMVSLCLMGCSPHDAQYFKLHPKDLQVAIASCPSRAPELVSCDALHQIAIEVNEMVYELRMSPQEFGKSILALQESIGKQEIGHATDTDATLEKLKHELKARMAIVRWLESPTS
jgi:hypothetical protein